MKKRSIIMFVLLVVLLAPAQLWSQQSQQPVKYYGYAGPDNDNDLNRVSSYTNFSYVDGVYGTSIAPQLTAIQNHGLRAVIDLGLVLWCPSNPNDTAGTWRLCSAGITGWA